MTNICEITGKKYQRGNQVSHSNRKMIKQFEPNMQAVSFYSEKLGKLVRLIVAASTIRTIDKKGGLDAFLTATPNSKLTDKAKKLKKQITKQAA